MLLLKNILVPINFSKCSLNALEAAVKLSNKQNDRITLFHVLDVVNTIIKDIDALREENYKKLQRIAVGFNIDPKIEIVKGLPAEEIVKSLNTGKFSICIMGTHERHGILSELVGTESMRVMQGTNIPLIIIPGDVKLTNIDRIAFATDFQKLKNLNILNHLKQLCLACDAKLHLLNINESDKSLTPQVASEALQLHQYLFDVDHTFAFSSDKDPIEGMMNYMRANDVDLLAVMPRNHSFFHSVFNDSVTERLALHLEVPMFSFHE